MNDRTAYITSTNAAASFPGLATFLAEKTDLHAELVEQALRTACTDALAHNPEKTSEIWGKAVRLANGDFGTEPAATGSKADSAWSQAIAAANMVGE